MPDVKIKHIVSFSSEEQPHKADNLLRDDTTKKWKCAPGENQASVVLQLEKSTKISSIDIGNEGSAFIEVLVGRSSSGNIKYQVLLVASSFMSPQESRVGKSPNKVRIFNKEKLAPDVVDEKWDIVKIVCTQPFNKRASYGLSFVKLHSISETTENTPASNASSSTEKKTKQFGGFKLKDDNESKKPDILQPGMQMLMAKKEEASGQSKRKEIKRRSTSPDPTKQGEKRRKVEKIQIANEGKPKSAPVKFDQLKKKKEKSTQNIASQSSSSTAKNVQMKRKKNTPNIPFDRILNGVIFVISGFQNPLRGEIREKALQMGAQYRKDWTPDSTHLICAFPNTPKYRHVIGCGGKIVKKDWIEDCDRQMKRISWKKYSMNPGDSSSSSSSEQEDDTPETVNPSPDKKSTSKDESDDPYEASTDDGADTEDEIEKVLSHIETTPKDNRDDDPYNASTDEEETVDNQESSDELPVLPDFFEKKEFMLYGEFEMNIQRLLIRHIIACGGKVSKYMSDDVDYVVTEQKWDDEFDKALSSNAALIFVKPSWVFHCGAQQKLLPYQPYVIAHS